MTRLFGALDAEGQAQIRSLTLAQLEELAEALLDFITPIDLQRWLNQHPISVEIAPTG